MKKLGAFNQNNPLILAMTLIYNSEYYNNEDISKLARALKEKFMQITGQKPKGKNEFCAFVIARNQSKSPIAPIEIIGTKFFQSMQKVNPVHLL